MTAWTASPTRTFLNELLNLPKKVSKLVPKKIELIETDPISVQGDAKKLKDYSNVYRVRIGDYRLFYTFGSGWVKLLSIRKRDERTYNLEKLPDFAIPTAPPKESTLEPKNRQQVASSKAEAYAESFVSVARTSKPSTPKLEVGITTSLPYALTEDLLQQWQIPTEYWKQIKTVENSEKLLELDLPVALLERILDNLFPRPLEEIETQPEFFLKDLEDLNRFVEGTLTDFLLRLDPEQKKLQNFGKKGPTLVKGGPGTGKSTLAIYRVKKLLEMGYASILFTTYTNALVNYSNQLLTQLLEKPPEKAGVKVSTVDSLAFHYAKKTYGKFRPASNEDCLAALETALRSTEIPSTNVFDRQVRLKTLTKLGTAYLLEEFLSVIEAWEISALDDYLAFKRRGRGYPLRANIREAIWAVYQTWQQVMQEDRCLAWDQIRRVALQAARKLPNKPFDAVLIDEAQDLSPTALRLLIELTPSLEGIYLTADASQSLYQRGFSWSQIHSDLQVRGRTLLLKRNYRNTQQIAAACADLLKDTDAGDVECIQQTLSPYQGAVPQVVIEGDESSTTQAIGEFFLNSAKQFRLPLHGGAVLVPTQQLGRAIAKQLTQLGLEAKYVTGKKIDINLPYIKVLTLHSAKGLEFPFVAVAGLDENLLPAISPDIPEEEQPLVLDEQRRLLYVGCSRAMRSLIVCTSRDNPSRFVEDLRSPYWQK